MKQEHVLKRTTYRVVNNFFEEYPDIIEKSPVLKEAVTGFNERYTDLGDHIETVENVKTISTLDKDDLKTKIATNIRKGLDKIMVQAVKDKNKTLKEACSTTLSVMQKTSHEDFVTTARNELKRLAQNADILDKAGFKKDFLKALSTDINTFEKMIPTMHRERKKTSIFRSNQDDKFTDIQEYMDIVVRDAINDMAEVYPDFVKEYDEISAGKAPKSSQTLINILTLDESGKPLSLVGIIIDELTFTGQTDVDSKLLVKVGAKKSLIIKSSRTGFVNQETEVSKIKRGQTTDIVVTLRAAAVQSS